MAEVDPIRLQIADVLEVFAKEPTWNTESSSRFDDLLKLTEVDGLLAYASDELIHYSGEFNSFNFLGMRVKPNSDRVADYKETFRMISIAIRRGTAWDEFKRKNNIYETGEILPALSRWFKRRFTTGL